MVDKTQGAASEGDDSAAPAPAATPATPRRAGHRGMDPRETIAELTAKAHEISQYAGTKVGAAMKDVIGAAAGLTGFAVESARDLIQYMVRRGQMTQIEGDKLLREVEAAHGARKPAPKVYEHARAATQRPPTAEAPKRKAAGKEARLAKKTAAPTAEKSVRKAEDKPATRKPVAKSEKPAAQKETDKPASKSTTPPAEKGGKKAAEKSPTPKAAATKSAAKGAAKKAAPKGSASRTESAPRPKAASKSAPVRKKK